MEVERQIRIGIDYRPALLNRAGIGRYTRELVRGMAACDLSASISLFAYSWMKPVIPPKISDFQNPRIRYHRKKVPNKILNLLHRFTGVGIETFIGPLDLFHHTHLAFSPLKKTPFVSTVHDTAFLEEGWFPESAAKNLKERAEWLVRHSRLLIVPSVFAAGELVMKLRAQPERIVVTPLGCDHLQTLKTPLPQADPPFFLTVGTIEPRKNHLRILEAFERAAKKIPHHWVIAGGKGWLYEPFFEKLANSPVKNRVRIRETPCDEELASLYRQADFLVYPSLYEGFGLPPAEAMHCGTPVLTSAVASMPEVCAGAAYEVDPRSTDAILEGILEIAGNPTLRSSLREKGKIRARELRWEETARTTLGAYSAACRGVTGSMKKFF